MKKYIKIIEKIFVQNDEIGDISKAINQLSQNLNETANFSREIGKGNFNVDSGRKSISGHSMGGHGALTIALKNPGVYRSVSAFSPIVAPMDVPWGQKAFQGYLGEDKALFLTGR